MSSGRTGSRPSISLTPLTAGGLCVYAAIVGQEPSVTRATAAAVVFLVARAFDHDAPPLNTLALTDD